MINRSKKEVLELLNKQVKRTYRASLLSGILFLIYIVLVFMFMNKLQNSMMVIGGLILIANYKRIEFNCREELGYIYVNNRLVCSKLSFFSVIEKDVTLKCMLGIVKIDKIIKDKK